jgi:hypothetical protein
MSHNYQRYREDSEFRAKALATSKAQYAAASRERKMLTRVKWRAKMSDTPFNLELSDIKIPECCPILGIPLFIKCGRGGPGPNSPSLDRIKPELGYVKGNVEVISQKANVIKQNASSKELRLVADWVESKGL